MVHWAAYQIQWDLLVATCGHAGKAVTMVKGGRRRLIQHFGQRLLRAAASHRKIGGRALILHLNRPKGGDEAGPTHRVAGHGSSSAASRLFPDRAIHGGTSSCSLLLLLAVRVIALSGAKQIHFR